jgi:hypothetical protein
MAHPPNLLEEAIHPATSPERLRELAEFPECSALVAQNPNAPPDVLVRLMRSHPREVLENPVLPILSLEAPSFFEDLSDTALLALVEQPNAPTQVVSVALTRQGWLFDDLLAAHPKTPPELLVKMSRSERPRLRMNAGKNPNTPADALRRLGEDTRPEVRWAVAENPSAPPELLLRLASDQTMGARFRVAKNPKASEELLSQLAADSAWEVRLQVVAHPAATRGLLDRLSHDEDERITRAALLRAGQADEPSLSS